MSSWRIRMKPSIAHFRWRFHHPNVLSACGMSIRTSYGHAAGYFRLQVEDDGANQELGQDGLKKLILEKQLAILASWMKVINSYTVAGCHGYLYDNVIYCISDN